MRPRFVLYAAVLAFLGFVLVTEPFATAKEPPFWTLRGTTDQGADVKLHLDPKGRVRTFSVNAKLHCDIGRLASPPVWEPSEGGAPAQFVSRGPRFVAFDRRHFYETGQPTVGLQRVIRGKVSSGHASGTVDFTTTPGSRGVCSSGPVHWSAD